MEISTEVAFQKGSALATGLTAVFSEAIQFKKNLADSPTKNKKVLEHVVKVTIPAMDKVISDTTGINVHDVQLSSSFSCNFGTVMYLGDNPGAISQILYKVTGDFINEQYMYEIMRSVDMQPISYEALVATMNAFDQKLSYYRENFGNPKSLSVSMDIFFDPYGAFLMKETVHPDAPEFTPEEITAVVLHEIGHMISVLEMTAEAYYMNDVIKRSTEYFGEHASPEEVLKYIKNNLLSHEMKVPKGLLDKLSVGLESKGTTFKRIICSIMNGLSLAGITLVPFSILIRCFGDLVDKSRYKSLNLGIKQSDLFGYTEQFKQAENYADNFVVRHGYGSYLVSAINKMDIIQDHKSAIKHPVDRWSSLHWSLAKFPSYVAAILCGTGSIIPDEHGTFIERAKNMMDETLKIFKNDNLPADVLSYYLNDYKRCQQLLQQKSTVTATRDLMDKFYHFIEYVAATPFAIFGTARFEQEYEKFVQQVNSLKNNKLYYFKAVFQNYLNNH